MNQGQYSPTFDSATFNYNMIVGSQVSNIDVSATLTDAAASLQINFVAIGSNVLTNIPLAFGDNSIRFDVLSQDGVSSTTYILTVTRLTGRIQHERYSLI